MLGRIEEKIDSLYNTVSEIKDKLYGNGDEGLMRMVKGLQMDTKTLFIWKNEHTSCIYKAISIGVAILIGFMSLLHFYL
jgi:hypothetical protein